MALTKGDVQKLTGQDLADAVLQQVLGWTRAGQVTIDGGVSVDDAWFEQLAQAVRVRPRATVGDIVKDEWALRVIQRMADLGKRLVLQAAQGGYSCAFVSPGATTSDVTAAAVSAATPAWAILWSAVFAVQS